MNGGIRTERLRVGGMTCVNCQEKIERRLRKTAGVVRANVSYTAGTADVAYDGDVISIKDIASVIRRLDYTVETGSSAKASGALRAAGLLTVVAALYLVMEHFGVLNLLVPSRLAEAGMGYGMLFVIGLITSVHCVAMCGGINLSQCMPRGAAGAGEGRLAALRPTFLYNLGRVISYTVVGFLVGALGSVATLSYAAQGALKLVAGVCMIVMGVNMLGIFPWLRRLNPRMPRFFARKISAEKGKNNNSPLIVGLLNGLMPCGPLQAMQIYALSTGNAFSGALSMLLFSLGTVPLMFGLGALSSVLGRKFTRTAMAVGAVLVVVLGLSMLTQGWSLAGIALPKGTTAVDTPSPGAAVAEGTAGDVQVVNSTLSSGRYPSITVAAGTPVRWVIDAPKGSVNGCNNRIYIPAYDIEYTFAAGENVIEFTPEQTGTFQYSCWMGMIRASITVTEASAAEAAAITEVESASAEPRPAGYAIPTDDVAVAEMTTGEAGNNVQVVQIVLTDAGFSPAVVVVEAGTEVAWNIDNQKTGGEMLAVPAYATQIPLDQGENTIGFGPEADFDFATGDYSAYGYVKVVDDLNAADLAAIRAEAGAHETLIYPPDYFQSAGGGSCCQ